VVVPFLNGATHLPPGRSLGPPDRQRGVADVLGLDLVQVAKAGEAEKVGVSERLTVIAFTVASVRRRRLRGVGIRCLAGVTPIAWKSRAGWDFAKPAPTLSDSLKVRGPNVPGQTGLFGQTLVRAS